MAITYFNSTEVESISNDIYELATQFEDEMTSLFKRFEEVPYVTKEWIGDKANFYFNYIALDRKQYMDFAESLKKISYNLNDTVLDVNKNIKDTKIKETEKGY
jgi:hypothetical protein